MTSISAGREVVPFIDRTYRTLGEGRRGIFGKSCGEYSALRGGMLHPDIWSAVAYHSGDLLFELCYASDFPTCCNIIKHAGTEGLVSRVSVTPAADRGGYDRSRYHCNGGLSRYFMAYHPLGKKGINSSSDSLSQREVPLTSLEPYR